MDNYKAFYEFAKKTFATEKITDGAMQEQIRQIRSAIDLMEILIAGEEE